MRPWDIIAPMKKLLIMTLFLYLSCLALAAHPHMLLIARLDFDFEAERCRGVWMDWEFDTMFSASIIESYDWDYSGSFDSEENQAIHDYAFSNLENYGYFISIREGDDRRNPSSVQEFTARVNNGKLFYRFFVSLGDWGLGKEFSVSVFDPTYFCAVQYQEPPILVQQVSGVSPEYRLEENKEYPIYYNPMGSVDDTRTYTQWKPGLETAYPQESHVWFD